MFALIKVRVSTRGGGGGGGGGFCLGEDQGRMFDQSLPAGAFVVVVVVVVKVEISSRTLIPLFTPGSVHSGSAS